MLFTSLQFVLFLAVLTVVYYLFPSSLQWPLLLLASVFFYYSIAHKLLIFVLFSGLSAWLAAYCIDRINLSEQKAVAAVKKAGGDRAARQQAKKRFLPLRRAVLAVFLLCTAGFLIFFKFYNMFVEWMERYRVALPTLRLAMPLGISFYTLMLITYLMDVYHARIAAEKNPAKVLLYTCFFPQVIQGPICRWKESAPQIFKTHRFSYENLVLGCERMLWGYFKKLVIADRLQILTSALYSGYETYQGFYVAVAAFAYTVQLYTDFSGGIDVALGAAEILDIHLTENFDRPFFSKNISEFWRRWHITLGNFLREELFYPLTFSKPIAALNRFFKKRDMRWAAKWIPTYIAMFIVWFISGIWHGEGLQYIANGLWHGFLITGGETIAGPSARLWNRLGVPEDSFTLKLFRVCRTFCLVAIGEIMFRSESTAMMAGMLKGLFAVFNPWILFDGSLLAFGLDGKDFIVLFAAVFILLCASLAARKGSLRSWLNRQELPVRWGILLAGLFSIVVFGVYGPAYDPTPFIYFQF